MATFDDLLNDLKNASGVQEAVKATAAPVGNSLPNVWQCIYHYAVAGGTQKVKAFAHGEVADTASAVWEKLPDVLKPTPAEETYFGSYATPANAIELVCNAKWRGISGNSGAKDILDFSIQAVNDTTIRVEGLFHEPSASPRVWKQRKWAIGLIDPLQAPSAGNAYFEEITSA